MALDVLGAADSQPFLSLQQHGAAGIATLLVAKGREAAARLMMRRLWGRASTWMQRSPRFAIREYARTAAVVEPEKERSRNFLRSYGRHRARVLPTGVGHQRVMYFGEYLWAAAGFTEEHGLLINVTLGAVLVISTLFHGAGGPDRPPPLLLGARRS